MLIVDRYIIREIAWPSVLIGALLTFLYIGFSATRHLAEAAEVGLPYADVFQLIGYEALIAVEMLFPMALFLAVVIGIGRMHADHEIIALYNAGMSEFDLLKVVARFSLLVAIIVGVLSIYVRPWAYEYIYQMKAQSKDNFDLDKIKAEHFYSIDKDKTNSFVIYASAVEPRNNRLNNVFFSTQNQQRTQVIRAEYAIRPETQLGAPRELIFHKGYSYDMDQRKPIDVVLNFSTLKLPIGDIDNTVGYKAKSAQTLDLKGSPSPKDLAEFQWRITRPLATILLAILAVPLSRTKPRQGRYSKAVWAIILYAVYFNLTGMAKSWVKDGAVGAIPGLWWPEVLLFIAVLVMMGWPYLQRLRGKRQVLA
ncbi:MAG: LPS export ABC transporter permease LptF [Methylococcales bacterium]